MQYGDSMHVPRLILLRNKGFTLIEIAVVIIVIGIVVAGITKGTEMINQSKLVTLTGVISNIKANTIAFTDRYRCLPGDFDGASAMGLGTSGDCDGRISSGEANNFWNHLESLYPKSVQGTINGAALSPEGWDRDNFQLSAGAYSDNTSWNGVLRGNNIASTMGFKASEAKFINAKLDNGAPFSGTVLSDNDECVDHDESGAEPSYASNDFGSGTASGGDTDACLIRILVDRWLGRGFGLVAINSAGGGGGCASCANWGLSPLTLCPTSWSGYLTYQTGNGLTTCGYATFVGFMNDPGNFWHTSGCGYTAPAAITNTHPPLNPWYALCAPCNFNSDCPSGSQTIGTQTKNWSPAYQTCYDSMGNTNSGNPGYCTFNFTQAQNCSRLCTNP